MIRGLLSIRNTYNKNAFTAMSRIGVDEQKRQLGLSDRQEVFGIISSLLSLATMKSMNNDEMKKNLKSGVMPENYRIVDNSLFHKIFGSPYTIYKDGDEVDYQQFMIDKYKLMYGDK